MIRLVVGSVGHQKHACFCYGGTGNGDPEGMTLREAARAAYEHCMQQHAHELLAMIPPKKLN